MSENDSISSLIDAYKIGDMSLTGFDDAFWLVMSDKVGNPHDLDPASPVALYYASRYMEWDVANGGFSQAAYNIPDLFALAAAGYRAMNLNAAADLIDKAAGLADNERKGFTASTIGKLFQQFSESKLAGLDAQLDRAGWWATEQRVGYAIQHRKVFELLDRS
ncbi:MAG: DUF4375 domain-containing protein [Silicimonas sp.]|nr:DUF4375 domain-containing protein [Silicimonas sp.]